MTASNKILSDITGHPCPTCGKERKYKTQQGADRSKGRNCRSCANSISSGGVGCAGTCVDCGSTELYKNSTSLCKQCHNARSKKYHEEVYRYSKYGITKEQFDTIFTGSCEICNTSVTRSTAHIDHCHATGDVRGILCGNCNKALGLFFDNTEALANAIKYLSRGK